MHAWDWVVRWCYEYVYGLGVMLQALDVLRIERYPTSLACFLLLIIETLLGPIAMAARWLSV